MTGIVIPDGGNIGSTSDTDALTISSSGAVTLSSDFVPATPLSHRNMVINGAMQVAQRGNVTGKTSSTYGGPDRFKTEINALGTWSISQNTTNTPTDKGFKNSLKLEITANAESSIGGTSDYVNLQQRFEGQDVQHIRKGTSEAKQLTLSFWVKSNVTGNYNIELTDVDNSRHVTALSTIDSADTWEYKTHTFPADTTGAFDNDNVQSLRIAWWLSAGTTFTSGSRQTTWSSTSNGDRAVGNFNLASADNNYYEITGVQLELGSVATPFEHRSYADELARCQRYYEVIWGDGTNGYGGAWPASLNSSTNRWCSYQFKVQKRAIPAGSLINGASVTGDTGVTMTPQFSRDFVNFNFNSWGYIDGSTDSPGYELDAEF
jgi:hypothetical protein